jgi:AraC-like DNA-binding protein
MALSILVVRGLVEAIERSGLSRDRFFAAAGFDSHRLDAPEGRIGLMEVDSLHELALDLTGEAALGLRMGEMADLTTYSLIGNLVAQAPTLREAFDMLVRFHRLVVDRPAWRLIEAGDTATLQYDVAPGPPRCRRLRAEVSMTGFYRMVQYFGRGAQPLAASFEHAAPSYEAEYARIFEGTARFDQPFTGIVVERALLGASAMYQDPEFHAALEAQAQKRIARLSRTASYADRVREHLIQHGASQRSDMNAVARALGLSVRSLRRRLYDEGISYNVIVEEALGTLAKQLLADEGRSIQETAYAMGFSDPSAFYRAFKRWTGTTPKSFRSVRPMPSA